MAQNLFHGVTPQQKVQGTSFTGAHDDKVTASRGSFHGDGPACASGNKSFFLLNALTADMVDEAQDVGRSLFCPLFRRQVYLAVEEFFYRFGNMEDMELGSERPGQQSREIGAARDIVDVRLKWDEDFMRVDSPHVHDPHEGHGAGQFEQQPLRCSAGVKAFFDVLMPRGGEDQVDVFVHRDLAKLCERIAGFEYAIRWNAHLPGANGQAVDCLFGHEETLAGHIVLSDQAETDVRVRLFRDVQRIPGSDLRVHLFIHGGKDLSIHLKCIAPGSPIVNHARVEATGS